MKMGGVQITSNRAFVYRLSASQRNS